MANIAPGRALLDHLRGIEPHVLVTGGDDERPTGWKAEIGDCIRHPRLQMQGVHAPLRMLFDTPAFSDRSGIATVVPYRSHTGSCWTRHFWSRSKSGAHRETIR